VGLLTLLQGPLPDWPEMELFPVYRQLRILTCRIERFFSSFWSCAAPLSLSQVVDTETCAFAGLSTSVSGGNSISGRVSVSETTAKLRLPRTCDRRTMQVVVSRRLTSPERVTTGVGLPT